MKMREFLKKLFNSIEFLIIIMIGFVFVAIVVFIFLVSNEVNIENCRKLFGILRNIQIFDMTIGSILCVIVISIVLVSWRSYSTKKQSYREIENANEELQKTSKLYDPQNAGGVIKPLYDKASEFIDREKSPFIPLINSAQDHLSESQKALKQITDFERWGDGWKSEAMRALAILKLEALKTHIITQSPEDYPKFLQEEGGVFSVEPATNIKLLGSMVGFYFLLPSAIRNYICKLGNRFQTLEILATQKKYSERDAPKSAFYALAFVAKTLESILYGKCNKSFKETSGLSFKIRLYFSAFDFMNAAIMIENKSVAILQALGPESVAKILNDGLQIGIKVRKEFDSDFPLGQVYFERYHKVIEGYFDAFEEKNIETWEMSGNEEHVKLIITNGHWDNSYNFSNQTAECKTFHKTTEKDEIKEFLSKFKTKVCEDAGINVIDHGDIAKLKNKFDDVPCNCQKSV